MGRTDTHSHFRTGTQGHNDGAGIVLDDFFNLLPPSVKVNVTFTTKWLYHATVSSLEVGLENYHVLFLRYDSVRMTVQNRTALSASAESFLRNMETQPVQLTYRQVPYSTANSITYSLLLGSSIGMFMVIAEDRRRHRDRSPVQKSPGSQVLCP